MKNKAYRSTDVKSIDLERVTADRQGRGVTVGLDVGKHFLFVVLRWDDKRFDRPWKVANPSQLRLLVSLLGRLRQGRSLTVALEPTGTYADCLRQMLHNDGFQVHKVNPKKAHDYSFIFDGVPSQHDGKDAAVVADLAALGKSSVWPFFLDEAERELLYQVRKLDLARKTWSACQGRLEALLACHWPEASSVLKPTSATLLRCLRRYGGPAGMLHCPDARKNLSAWGGRLLNAKKVDDLLLCAKETAGVRQMTADARWLSECALEALNQKEVIRTCQRALNKLVEKNEILRRQAQAVGKATACVLWAELGDPREYSSAEAYRKAMGLNLAEYSSGKWEGKVHLSKRGARAVRRWLYFAALRLVRKTGGNVRRWYEAKKARDQGEVKRALVAVMRKLALALYNVVKGDTFDSDRLFAQVVAESKGE